MGCVLLVRNALTRTILEISLTMCADITLKEAATLEHGAGEMYNYCLIYFVCHHIFLNLWLPLPSKGVNVCMYMYV